MWLVLAALAAAAFSGRRQVHPSYEKRVLEIIDRAAAKHGVPVNVARAFAWVESKLRPLAQGDEQWATKRPEKYRQLVLDNPKMAHNPAREDPSAWRSYGLFGLLAAYHARPDEHPRVLLDPEINADRGVATIARLLRQHGGDAVAARLAYVGCGADGSRCSAAYSAEVRARFLAALHRFEGVT